MCTRFPVIKTSCSLCWFWAEKGTVNQTHRKCNCVMYNTHQPCQFQPLCALFHKWFLTWFYQLIPIFSPHLYYMLFHLIFIFFSFVVALYPILLILYIQKRGFRKREKTSRSGVSFESRSLMRSLETTEKISTLICLAISYLVFLISVLSITIHH